MTSRIYEIVKLKIQADRLLTSDFCTFVAKQKPRVIKYFCSITIPFTPAVLSKPPINIFQERNLHVIAIWKPTVVRMLRWRFGLDSAFAVKFMIALVA